MRNLNDTVYSSYPEFEYEYANIREPETLPPHLQNLTVSLEQKKPDGMIYTVIGGFVGKRMDLLKICEALKGACDSCGGSKMYDIKLMGDVRRKAYLCLKNKGYNVVAR